MTHLILKAEYYTDDNWFDVEYCPTHFILEIDPPIVKHLRELLSQTQSNTNPDMVNTNYYFGFGLWVSENEITSEISFVDNHPFVDFGEKVMLIPELELLDSYQVSIDRHGNFSFHAYGKYDGNHYYTTSVDWEALRDALGNRMIEIT
jgi:hypothetical protein